MSEWRYVTCPTWASEPDAGAVWWEVVADGITPAAIRQVGPRWYRWGAVGGGRGHRRSLAAAKRACAAWLAGVAE